MLQLTRAKGQSIRVGRNRLTIKKIQNTSVLIEVTRRVGEKLGLDQYVTVDIMDIQRNQVRLGIEAPKEIPIYREEKEPYHALNQRAHTDHQKKEQGMANVSSSSQEINSALLIIPKEAKKTEVRAPKILVVEDNVVNQQITRLALENRGYSIDIAATGQEALSLYKTNSYDLILMDMGLPDIAGTVVTKEIRKIELENGLHTPIIALTSNGIKAKKECLDSGMDDFSEKPFEIKKLDRLIKSWLKN
jgi:carbon storage regulator CsrA